MQAKKQADQHARTIRRPIRALRLPAVLEKTGLSRTHLYRLTLQGKFPSSHRLSERVAVWDEEVIDIWLAEKFAGGQP